MLPLLMSAATIVALDQLSKYFIRSQLAHGESFSIIDGFLQITHVQNTGAIFGLFADWQLLFIIAAIGSIVLVVVYYIKMKETHVVFNIALGLELGGAIGNLIDRIGQGHVTDFIHLSIWPVFNIADSAIVIGVVLLVYVALINLKGTTKRVEE